jgi:hypothetical protein
MLDPNKIKERLERDYDHVKSFSIGHLKEPAFMACNFGDKSFMLVSIYMDSEIGGEFKLDKGYSAEYVYNQFDVAQAEDLRNGMIEAIIAGDAEIQGSITDPKKLH